MLRDDLVRLRSDHGIPAIGAVIVSAAGVEAVALDGVRRSDGADAVLPADRFHLGSNAKAMTAMLASLAVGRGEIGWDTPAAALLGIGRPTLRQLLTHSGGIHPYTEDDEIAGLAVPTTGTAADQRAHVARAVLAEEPLFAPGARHEYSNAGVVTAAAMVEAASGESWEDGLRARIFGPLGLDGVFGWPALHATDAPLGHRVVDGRAVPHDPATDPYALPPWAGPAGDVSMPIEDYGRFLADQLAGLRGDGRLGRPEAYRSIHTPDPPDSEGAPAFALGWGVRHAPGGPISMHTGSADTFYAVAVLEPARDRGMAAVANIYSDEHERAINGLIKRFLAE